MFGLDQLMPWAWWSLIGFAWLIFYIAYLTFKYAPRRFKDAPITKAETILGLVFLVCAGPLVWGLVFIGFIQMLVNRRFKRGDTGTNARQGSSDNSGN